MPSFEYDFGFTEEGKFCVLLPKDEYDNLIKNVELKFFVFDICRVILNGVIEKNKTKYDEEFLVKLKEFIDLLNHLTDDLNSIVFRILLEKGKLSLSTTSYYHIILEKKEDLDALKIGNYIYQNNKIFEIENGLKVLVTDLNKVFTLENNQWVET